MCPDWVPKPGPLAVESDVLPTALCGLALIMRRILPPAGFKPKL